MTNFQDDVLRKTLREPFAPEQIGKLRRKTKTGGHVELDYVGHAAVSDRLNQQEPGWSYGIERAVESADGLHVQAVVGWVEIGGKRLPEVGEPNNQSSYGQEFQSAIGNLIRRGAMRFGVGIDLWSKEDLQAAGDGRAEKSDEGQGIPASPAQSSGGERESGENLPSADHQGVGPAPSSPGASPATDEQWQRADALGLTSAKAVRAAKAKGWPIHSSTDITGEQLADLITEVMA